MLAWEGLNAFENSVVVDDRGWYARRGLSDRGFCMIMIRNSAIRVMMVVEMMMMMGRGPILIVETMMVTAIRLAEGLYRN